MNIPFCIYSICSKTKETYSKIRNGLYPLQELLRQCFDLDDVHSDVYSVVIILKPQTISRFLSSFTHPISRNDITFGFMLSNKKGELCSNAALAKVYTHKARVFKISLQV